MKQINGADCAIIGQLLLCLDVFVALLVSLMTHLTVCSVVGWSSFYIQSSIHYLREIFSLIVPRPKPEQGTTEGDANEYN